ncbi:MAG: hypothetical protein QOK28_3397 [Actinomycetota bacterium]|jgi:hypothetical protein
MTPRPHLPDGQPGFRPGTSGLDLLRNLRNAAATIADDARRVRVVSHAIPSAAAHLAPLVRAGINVDPAYFLVGPQQDVVANYVLTINAINFGSGWHPHLAKDPGSSGSRTMMRRIRDFMYANGPFDASMLARIEPAEIATILGQSMAVPVGDLMTHYARSLNQLGRWLLASHDGSAVTAIEASHRSAANLVAALAEMPSYQDAAETRGTWIPFLKRAQLTAADLAVALDGNGLGEFDDLHELTVFADNLVPHVLRLLGVLEFDDLAVRRIDAGELLDPGSEFEIEMRAGAVAATERLVAAVSALGTPCAAYQLDYVLWQLGQAPEYKSVPRPRIRSTFY